MNEIYEEEKSPMKLQPVVEPIEEEESVKDQSE